MDNRPEIIVSQAGELKDGIKAGYERFKTGRDPGGLRHDSLVPIDDEIGEVVRTGCFGRIFRAHIWKIRCFEEIA